jgi:[NiFe] hydrogenase assembly HybE family chaperone
MNLSEWQDCPAQQARTLCTHFQGIADTRMRGLPFLNQQLVVEAVGFSAQIAGENAATGVLGILITPWFMNLIWLPENTGTILAQGASGEHQFGGQCLSFIGAEGEDIGVYESCSLFSPMFEFADQDAARQTAEQVLALLRNAPERPPERPAISRRGLLFGRASGGAQ